MSVVERTRSMVVDDKYCVGEEREKWICLPGPHHPGFFQNYCMTEDPKRIFQSQEPEPWLQYMPPRGPIDTYRLWLNDKRGLRKADWNRVSTDCAEPHTQRKFNVPYYQENHHKLLTYQNALNDFEARHPGKLLRGYVYRKPDYYLKHTMETMGTCSEGRVPVYKPLLKEKMSERCLHRMKFLTGNYQYLDDGFP